MSEPNRCEICGDLLAGDDTGRRCARCVDVGLNPDDSGVSKRTITLPRRMPQDANVAAPTMFGRYRILTLIGQGGMGAVYEAEQERPRRTVALKVIKPGLATPESLRRFEQEAQALGRLQHPGIAQIYEAGTADAGHGSQPYFAMVSISPR
jgi:serine/threonine protein kinase